MTKPYTEDFNVNSLYANPLLQAAVESAQRIIDQDSSDPHSVEELDRLINNINTEVSRYDAIDVIADQIQTSGMISTHDVHRLEKVSPGIITNHMSTDDFTFAPSVNGFEGAVEAINWAKIGKWGIIGAIITAILGIIYKLFNKIKEARDRKEKMEKEHKERLDEISRKAREELKVKRKTENIEKATSKEYGPKYVMDYVSSNTEKVKKEIKQFSDLDTIQLSETIALLASKAEFSEDKVVEGGKITLQEFLGVKSIRSKIKEDWKDNELNFDLNLDGMTKTIESINAFTDKMDDAIEKISDLIDGFMEPILQTFHVLENKFDNFPEAFNKLEQKISEKNASNDAKKYFGHGGNSINISQKFEHAYWDRTKSSIDDQDYRERLRAIISDMEKVSTRLNTEVSESLKGILDKSKDSEVRGLYEKILSYQSTGENFPFPGYGGSGSKKLEPEMIEVMRQIFRFRDMVKGFEESVFNAISIFSHDIRNYAGAYMRLGKHLHHYESLENLKASKEHGFNELCKMIRSDLKK